MIEERAQVLRDLEEAVKRFVSNNKSYLLIPEIRTNVGYALVNAQDTYDVAAIPGRLTVAFNKVIYCLPPAFGASDHIARVILTSMKFDPNIRSAMNLALYPQFFGLNPYVFDRTTEPAERKRLEKKTMNFMIEKAFSDLGRIPEFIIDKGDLGKEPGLFVLGKTPQEVVNKALQLTSLL
ncbi:MAG: thiamine-phosphate synthase family protein [Metallosphaera sp.]